MGENGRSGAVPRSPDGSRDPSTTSLVAEPGGDTRLGPSSSSTSWAGPGNGRRVQLVTGALAAAVVLIATRADPNLTPDSLTYLSAGEALRGLDGYVDFTGEPLAHFPPVYPSVLAVGGAGLWWASIVGAASAAVTVALLVRLVARRVGPVVALGAGIALALAQGAIWVWATVWSEGPYIALSVATIAVLAAAPVDARRCWWGGALAALAFLTRYAGAGLVVTGLAMVVAGTRSRGDRRRCVAAYLSAPIVGGSVWVVRNVARAGEPFGPHFEGGAGESLGTLLDRLARSTGRLVVDVDRHDRVVLAVGYVVLIVLLAAVGVAVLRRRPNVVDIGMGAFAITSIAVPLLARIVSATHIEARIMSPLLIPLVYFAASAIDRGRSRRLVLAGSALVMLVWSWQGIAFARDLPDLSSRSAGGEPTAATAALYRRVESAPPGASVLTNSPQRVWWHTGHVPTYLAFTLPDPGNSHFPLTASETVDLACTGDTFLVWFPGLVNAGGMGPGDLRPDVADQVRLAVVEATDEGAVYRVEPADQSTCSS